MMNTPMLLTNGNSFPVPNELLSSPALTLVGIIKGQFSNMDLLVVEGYGMTYALSPCCNASDKGSEDGIVCRTCYGPFEDGSYLSDEDQTRIIRFVEYVGSVRTQ